VLPFTSPIPGQLVARHNFEVHPFLPLIVDSGLPSCSGPVSDVYTVFWLGRRRRYWCSVAVRYWHGHIECSSAPTHYERTNNDINLVGWELLRLLFEPQPVRSGLGWKSTQDFHQMYQSRRAHLLCALEFGHLLPGFLASQQLVCCGAQLVSSPSQPLPAVTSALGDAHGYF